MGSEHLGWLVLVGREERRRATKEFIDGRTAEDAATVTTAVEHTHTHTITGNEDGSAWTGSRREGRE